jgi:hypothetical protein
MALNFAARERGGQFFRVIVAEVMTLGASGCILSGTLGSWQLGGRSVYSPAPFAAGREPQMDTDQHPSSVAALRRVDRF